MEKVTWTHPGIAHILQAIPIDTRTLLDVGCGTGVIGALCRIYRSVERQVGIDGYAPALALCEKHGFYDDCLQFDLSYATLPFADNSFDVVTCIEVVEHLERADGLRLLDELERVGNKVIVTTPNGYLKQEELANNPLQRHRSGWTVRDFTRRGYDVTGVGAMLVLGAHRKYISAALAPMTRVMPQLSELLLCEKRQPATPRVQTTLRADAAANSR